MNLLNLTYRLSMPTGQGAVHFEINDCTLDEGVR